jgi:tetratricopeptide (TPR) repeat protein
MPRGKSEPGATHARIIARAAALAALVAVAGIGAACGTHAMTKREQARDAWLDGDYETAAEIYEESLAEEPDGPEAEESRLALADTYYHKLKSYERARDQYKLFLDRYPNSAHAREARERLAEVYVELGSPREAIAEYEALVATEPATSDDARHVRSTIADLYYDEKAFDQAELEYNRVVENAPYDELTEQSLLRLATIRHTIRADGESAIPFYERVATSTADPAVKRTALHGLSQVYADLFRFDEAIEALERIDDPAEADYVAERTEELKRQKAEHGDAPEVDWSKGKGE